MPAPGGTHRPGAPPAPASRECPPAGPGPPRGRKQTAPSPSTAELLGSRPFLLPHQLLRALPWEAGGCLLGVLRLLGRRALQKRWCEFRKTSRTTQCTTDLPKSPCERKLVCVSSWTRSRGGGWLTARQLLVWGPHSVSSGGGGAGGEEVWQTNLTVQTEKQFLDVSLVVIPPISWFSSSDDENLGKMKACMERSIVPALGSTSSISLLTTEVALSGHKGTRRSRGRPVTLAQAGPADAVPDSRMSPPREAFLQTGLLLHSNGASSRAVLNLGAVCPAHAHPRGPGQSMPGDISGCDIEWAKPGTLHPTMRGTARSRAALAPPSVLPRGRPPDALCL
nr:uncharacterized protein LOC112932270 [Vulpes vulpes]